MTPEENARATWALLTERERTALVCIGDRRQVITPDHLGRALGTSWQAAVRTARALNVLGLISVRRLPKQTSYDISGQGEECLAAAPRCECGGVAVTSCVSCSAVLCGKHAQAGSGRGESVCADAETCLVRSGL